MNSANVVLTEYKRYTRYTQIINGTGAVIALALGIWILVSPERRTHPDWVFWLIWPMATLHTIEEYIFPGGFLIWFNRFAFNSTNPYQPLSAKRAFQTDAVTGLFNPILMIVFANLYFPLIFIFVFLLWLNAYFHITESIKHGSYFPGTITSILVYVPGISYVIYFYLSAGIITLPQLAIGFFGGLALTALFYQKVRGWQNEAAKEV